MAKSAKADKRNRLKESARWNPRKWTPERIGRFTRRVYRHGERELMNFFEPHEARIVSARLRSERNETVSVAALRARGIPLLGDQES